MTTIIIILMAILTPLTLITSIWFILTVTTDIVKEYNIRKYNTWWGKLPTWATNFMKHFM